MEINFREIEKQCSNIWLQTEAYKVLEDSAKPKYYILEMFPYPSGAGLHVGHPLGYIAADIYARYKRHKGFNVLHPMGFDAFGLPAEQYAIDTGQHPSITTQKNKLRYKEQLDKIGLSYDWSREITTSDPKYYKWTQWLFIQFFNAWYNTSAQKTESIDTLIAIFNTQGNLHTPAPKLASLSFTADEWKNFTELKQAEILMQYRIAYLDYAEVNWCEALGTVLANDEVVNGYSERGNHPVVKRKMKQWFLRITAYADRLLTGLDNLDWPEPMKEMQRNWIGKSKGAQLFFNVENRDAPIEVFTTRPDTIFGVSFLVLAPEHPLVAQLTTESQKSEIEDYLNFVKRRSERERIAETKKITGVFTGAYAIHPFTKKQVPVWISEYVLAGYGTGAIMAVPAGDSRDYAFAKHFNIPIIEIFKDKDISEKAFEAKDAVLCNSEMLDGLAIAEATIIILNEINNLKIGAAITNFKLRDAGFSRQRYWGEPFPIEYKNNIACTLPVESLPLALPHIENYSAGPDGQGPLANINEWVAQNLETNTMPGYAGSSWYFLRYMDPNNDNEFVSQEKMKYWGAVDFYLGGNEHAVGHLLYSRMWTKAMYDLNLISFDEPFKKLVNQGMIQGQSKMVYRIKGENKFVSKNLIADFEVDELHVDVSFTDGELLDIAQFKQWRSEYQQAEFVLENGKYYCGTVVEKMSKSKYNVINPDDVIEQYGADTFRMYEMFLGPIEISKPWDTKGIEGVSRFIKKLVNLYFVNDEFTLSNEKPNAEENKILHKTIKKIDSDIQTLSYNTCISQFMICVNELTNLQCNKKEILEPLLILLNPFAPFITEHLWRLSGNSGNLQTQEYPVCNESYLIENTFDYPVAINGKTRVNIQFELTASQTDIEANVLKDATVQKFLESKPVKKIIFVKGRMINIVV